MRPAGPGRAREDGQPAAAGTGSYHGEAGFQAFSHMKSIVHQGQAESNPLRYAPHGDEKLTALQGLVHQSAN